MLAINAQPCFVSELYFPMRVRDTFFGESVLDLRQVWEVDEKGLTQGVFALYLARSCKMEDKRPTWSMCGLATRGRGLNKGNGCQGLEEV